MAEFEPILDLNGAGAVAFDFRGVDLAALDLSTVNLFIVPIEPLPLIGFDFSTLDLGNLELVQSQFALPDSGVGVPNPRAAEVAKLFDSADSVSISYGIKYDDALSLSRHAGDYWASRVAAVRQHGGSFDYTVNGFRDYLDQVDPAGFSSAFIHELCRRADAAHEGDGPKLTALQCIMVSLNERHQFVPSRHRIGG